MIMIRKWQKKLEGIETECLIPDLDTLDTPEHSHDSVEDYIIVEPPQDGEDTEQAHGGDDVCRDVKDAPEREKASGEASDSSDSDESDDSSEESSGSEEAEDDETQESDSFGSEEDSDEEGDAYGEYQHQQAFELKAARRRRLQTAESDDSSEESSGSEEAEDDETQESDSFGSEEDSDEEGDAYGEYQHQQAFELKAACRRRLQTAVATILGKVAEDLAGWKTDGDDEWDVVAIMERRITRRSLNFCRVSREKDSVVLILDTSGSCSSMSQFFAEVADASVQAGDVELYEAPNAWLERRLTKKGWESVFSQHSHGWERFSRRKIIFFGDFDGGDALVIASRHNEVYWFSCEDRYTDLYEHSWCSYTLADFRGRYFNCTSEEDFLRLVRKVR